MREIDDYAGKKSGFGGAQEEAQSIERVGVASTARKTSMPRKPIIVATMPQATMMPRKPFPRAPALDDQVPGDLEQKVADEEDPRAEADDGIVEAEIALHLQLGDAQVGAVDVGKQIDQHQERHQASSYAPASALGDLEVGDGMQEKMVSRLRSARAFSIYRARQPEARSR